MSTTPPGSAHNGAGAGNDTDFGIIDSHVHVWDPRVLQYPWLDGVPALNRPMLPNEVDRADGRVRGMVFVQADCEAASALAEARWVAASEWPELRGIVAGAQLHELATLPRHLDALQEIPRMVGIRHNLQSEPDALFESADFATGLTMLARRGFTFDACVRHEQLPHLVRLIERVASVHIVLDHLGKPPLAQGIDSEQGRAWVLAIDALARFENVSVKVSGLATEAPDAATFDAHADAFIRHAVNAFGARRSMLGSDWPVTAVLGAGGAWGAGGTPSSFSAWAERVRRATAASASEMRVIESQTASEFYSLGLG